MHLNAFTIEILATEIGERLNGSHLVEAYSTSPTDLVFDFSTDTLQVQFVRGEIFFFLKESGKPARNKIPQFKSLHGKQLHKVEPHRYDRSFHLQFDEFELQFLCFGRNSRVYLNTGEEEVQFPYSKKVNSFSYKQIEFSESVLNELTIKNFGRKCRFADENQRKELEKTGFFDSGNRMKLWDQWVHRILDRAFAIDRSGEVPALVQINKPRNGSLFPVYEEFSKEYIRDTRTGKLKDKIHNQLNQEISGRKKKLSSIQDHAEDMSAKLSYRQRADLLMANLHQSPGRAKEIEVFDFFHDKDVKIPLKPDLNLQANAERYYRKSKNQHLELERRAEKIKRLQDEIAALEADLSALEGCEDIEELRKLDRTNDKSQKQQQTQHTVYQRLHFKNFEIWIGKNAKQNEAVLHGSSKNDVWLHLRDQPGSHVVIRNPQNTKIPEDVLTYAASLAAWHSKGKNEQTAAVIHTPRKFVRKFKGALPGQVKVDREDVILVDPEFWKEH